MLDLALTFLKEELNAYLAARTGPDPLKSEITRVVDDTGKYAITEGAIGLSVVHIEEDRVLRSQLPEFTYVNGQHVKREPELRLNVHVMVAVNFRHHDEALKALSHAMTFFQAHSSFESDRYPGLDARLPTLNVELMSLSYEQLNQVWAYIGGKFLPSVIYRVRLVLLQDQEQSAVQPPLTHIRAELGGR